MVLDDALMVTTMADMFLAGVYTRAALRESRWLIASLPSAQSSGTNK
jgi:hypothetical protein